MSAVPLNCSLYEIQSLCGSRREGVDCQNCQNGQNAGMQLSKCRDGHFHVQDWTF